MDTIVTVLLGVVCIVLGIMNRKGNISSLHAYHRKRVAEEDRVPFGKMVGLGTIIIGVALIVMGLLAFLAKTLQSNACSIVGNVILIVGFVIGLGLNFYAMIKYNKGIF